jgi:hypothetical protein
MKHSKIPILSGAAMALMLVSCKQPNTEVATTIEVPVQVIEVGTASIEEYVSTTGTVYPLKEESLNSEIAGDYQLQINPATGKTYALGSNQKSWIWRSPGWNMKNSSPCLKREGPHCGN